MVSRPDSKRSPDAAFRRRCVSADLNSPASRRAILSLTALGVVYGDIGTSSLYSFRIAAEVFLLMSPGTEGPSCSTASSSRRSGRSSCSSRRSPG